MDTSSKILVASSERQAVRLGLERINKFLDYLGNPQDSFKSVLIAGTNGKGSVTFYLSNLLCRFSKLKVGRFISPHLISWKERFIINEKMVDDRLLNNTFSEINQKIKIYEENTGEILTEFEIYTVLAFYLFALEKVDIAFLEIGMGGRLDATNVVKTQNVLCSVITNISLDHMDFLGNTLEEIAYEKAGIIKANNFVITGVNGKLLKVIEDVSSKNNSSLIKVNVEHCENYKLQNIEVAINAWDIIASKLDVEVDLNSAREYLKKLIFSGRFQFFEDKNILLDGAHNPAAVIELKKLLNKEFPNKKIIYIVGMLDKDYKSFISNLITKSDMVICTEPRSKRATKKECLLAAAGAHASNARTVDNLADSIKYARDLSHDLIVVTGSLYLVGEALELFNLE